MSAEPSIESPIAHQLKESALPKAETTAPAAAEPANGPKEHAHVAEPAKENNPFASMHTVADRLMEQIREGRNAEGSRAALSKLLRMRESYYRNIAMAINPDIQPVEGKENLYRVGDTEIYGTVAAAMDATPSLGAHKQFSEQISLQFSSDSETVIGETLQPRSFIESLVVHRGSNAQDRIQPFAADIDLNEYVKITAPDRKTAIAALAQALQRSALRPIETRSPDGQLTTAHLTGIKLGKYREGPLAGKLMTWTPSEIQLGYKTLNDAVGKPYQFTLQEACALPTGLTADYIGLSDDTVFSVSKIIDILAVDHEGKELMNRIKPNMDTTQQVFFKDPNTLGLLDFMYDADTYMQYVNKMTNEIQEKAQDTHLNKMKMMKRLYNLFKAKGDIVNAQTVSQFFSGPAAAIYQLEDRYKLGREAVAKGIMTGDQRQQIKVKLLGILNDHPNPLAREAETLLSSPHIHSVYPRFHATIKELINAEVDGFLENNPSVKTSLDTILASSNNIGRRR